MVRRKKTGGNASKMPMSVVKGAPGSNYVVVTLVAGEELLTSPGSLIYLRGDVEKGTIHVDGIGKAFARSFGGEDFLITKYKGGVRGGTVALGSPLPGDVIAIELAPNQDIIISRGSFLGCTSGLEVTATTRMQGILGIGQEEGFVLPVVRAGDKGGRVWLAAYGTFERVELKEGENIILDNGTFLACPTSLNYEVVSLGQTLMSSLLGGEGMGMEFAGPATLYLQSKNVNDFIAVINQKSGAEVIKYEVAGMVARSMWDGLMSSDGGGLHQNKPLRQTRKKRV